MNDYRMIYLAIPLLMDTDEKLFWNFSLLPFLYKTCACNTSHFPCGLQATQDFSFARCSRIILQGGFSIIAPSLYIFRLWNFVG